MCLPHFSFILLFVTVSKEIDFGITLDGSLKIVRYKERVKVKAVDFTGHLKMFGISCGFQYFMHELIITLSIKFAINFMV